MMYKILLITQIMFLFSSGCSNDGDENYIEGSGIIESTNIIVGSQVASTVKKILIEEGNYIPEGDTVLILDKELFDLQFFQAEAAVDFAKANLNLILAGARKEDINQAKEILNQSEIKLKQVGEDLTRIENLFSTQAITKKQLEDAQTAYDLALSQFNQANENYAKIVEGARPEEIEQTRANLKKAEASLALVEKQKRDCYITSPISGNIVKLFVEKGETVPLFSSLFKVSNLSLVELVIYIPETKLGKIKINQEAEVASDTFKDKVYSGRIAYISSEAEFTPKNIQTKDERTRLVYAVKIEIPNPDFELKDGMPADAKIIIND